MAEVWAVVVAAGHGSRMGGATGGRPKQYLPYRGEPMYLAFARTVARCPRVRGVVFVLPEGDVEAERPAVASLMAGLGLPFALASGGARRQDSVSGGLAALPMTCTSVLIHDAARPFATSALVDRVVDALEAGANGVVPAVSVTDTVKVVAGDAVASTLDRSSLRAVQTPQGFDVAVLRRAYAEIREDVTDDAALLERLGVPVRVVEGEAANMKITRPEDLAALRHTEHRTGYGYDVHAYVAEGAADARPLRLGGVPMDGGLFVRAHSDGDVLVHAVMDAVLGAMGEDDIGRLFPDTDAAYDGADSLRLLGGVMALAKGRGFVLRHVDATIVAQRPKIAPRRSAIRERLAAALGLAPGDVSIKATTEEGLGFTGLMQGLKAVAIAEGDLTVGDRA